MDVDTCPLMCGTEPVTIFLHNKPTTWWRDFMLILMT